MVNVLILCYKGILCMKCAVAIRGKGSGRAAALLGRVLALHWGPLILPLHPTSCVHIDHCPPLFAFSSHFHFLKSIYEGNFGCGYLKERRASGLVFCENTTSVYRALFVSPPAFLLFLSGNCESVA